MRKVLFEMNIEVADEEVWNDDASLEEINKKSKYYNESIQEIMSEILKIRKDNIKVHSMYMEVK